MGKLRLGFVRKSLCCFFLFFLFLSFYGLFPEKVASYSFFAFIYDGGYFLLDLFFSFKSKKLAFHITTVWCFGVLWDFPSGLTWVRRFWSSFLFDHLVY